MSFKADLQVAGNTYSVVQCHIPITQKYDQKGKPSSGVHSGQIKVILEGTDDGALGSWMADPTKKQDGKLTFYRIDQESVFKEIEFEGAYMMTLIEHFTTGTELVQSLLMEEDIVSVDITASDDEDAKQMKFNHSVLRNCQHRTGMSYCMMVSLTAEKIKIDGVEHQN